MQVHIYEKGFLQPNIGNGQCNYDDGEIIVFCLRFMATSNSKVDKKMCFCDKKIMILSVKH